MTTLELPVPATPAVMRPREVGPVPVRVRVPGRVLLLVAGLPGAGKSTLLAGLPPRPGLVVLDSQAQRAALASRFPGLTYRRYRPLVHLLHRLAVVRAALSDAPTVVVHLPATAVVTRLVVAALAAVTGRGAHLLWLHVDPADALAGQHDRGRVVPPGSFAAHVRRAGTTHRRLLPGRHRGFTGVTVVDRAAARGGLVLDAHPPYLPGSPAPEVPAARAEGHRSTGTPYLPGSPAPEVPAARAEGHRLTGTAQ